MYGYVILQRLNALIILSLVLSLLSSITNSMSWCLSKNINKKFETLQYSVYINLGQPEGKNNDDDIDDSMQNQLLHIKTYRGCRKKLRKQITLEFGISRSKLEIGHIGLTGNGCYIQIVHIMIDSSYGREKMFSSIYTLWEDHGDAIEKIIKKLYHLKWDIEINVGFTPNGNNREIDHQRLGNRILSDDESQQGMIGPSGHHLLEMGDDSSSDTQYI